ncbi:MAG TPA: tetratricopeptide repeat protein [Planctomycetaceae bacterium]|nr:tetratricopeptide repeat protein [Planctomycetaceae bacterium]
MNSWWDQLLIISTPLLVVPVVFLLASPWVGVQTETIAMVVTAFFALGHHLPGMIRAYGDKELFHRFRLRFILTPLVFVGLSIPLYRYHYNVFLLILYFWGCWHGLMQLYGFVRIYDAKVGSTAAITAQLDWLMCLCWFPTALLFSQGKTADFLSFWYSFGGPFISPAAIAAFRWICLSFSIAVLTAFLVNHAVQSYRGRPPNPIKLLMLSSGIGFWWFSFVYVEFSGLSVTLYEVAHDVQYMAITWLYNCRRVKSSPEFDGFMRFVFRRGMALLYMGLIAAYGAIGLLPRLVENGALIAFFNAFILISTILHYYYDGFIWKVREQSTQAGLGVGGQAGSSRTAQAECRGLAHLLKWSPLILLVGWLFVTDFTDPTLSPEEKEGLRRRYEQQLSGSAALPDGDEQKSWLYSEFDQALKIAQVVPGDRNAQMRAAIMLTNFGRPEEAASSMERLLDRQPALAEGHQLLGEIQLHRGNFDRAAASFQSAVALAKSRKERTNANLKLAEAYLNLKQFELAKAIFQEAVRDNPQLESLVDSLRKKNQRLGAPQ